MPATQNVVKVIDVPATTGGRVLELAMSGEEGKALAFLTASVMSAASHPTVPLVIEKWAQRKVVKKNAHR